MITAATPASPRAFRLARSGEVSVHRLNLATLDRQPHRVDIDR